MAPGKIVDCSPHLEVAFRSGVSGKLYTKKMKKKKGTQNTGEMKRTAMIANV